MVPGLVWGSALFGVGWALSGVCPGTALAQVGEGQLAGAVVVLGILGGAWLKVRASRPARRSESAVPSPSSGVREAPHLALDAGK